MCEKKREEVDHYGMFIEANRMQMFSRDLALKTYSLCMAYEKENIETFLYDLMYIFLS